MRWVAAIFCVALASVPLYARHKSDTWARTQFAKAATMQEALGGRPVADRSRKEYEHVIEAYRRVYFGAPASSKAEPSVVACAELMVEMGRRFNDAKVLNLAITKYEFLRREYPGSKYRFQALFTIGEIYKDDLNNPEKARATFEDFVERYPRNHLADDAKKTLAELQKPVKPKNRVEETSSKRAGDSVTANPDSADRGTGEAKESKMPRVTGIRHWSNPDYTRVAIDLEQEVKFQSSRIASPDRIFFDLRNTRLASTLVGKTFDGDDGLLQKIRVAESKPGQTRIVLEVGELSDYHAFQLSNPPRLMIDIHGKSLSAAQRKKEISTADADDERSEHDIEPTPFTDLQQKSAETKEPTEHRTGAKQTPFKVENAADIKADIKKVIVDDTDDTSKQSSPEISKVVALKPVKKLPAATSTADLPANVVASVESPAKTDGSEEAAIIAPTREIRGAKTAVKLPAGLDIHEAQPRSDGDRSLIRALGLKIGKIVIDPGHGGHDAGTIGPKGLQEKELVLDVSRRLGKLLENRMGSEVVYTRHDDTFIPLETRTAIANQEQADLFVSVHANSSHDPDARGVETYYLNFTSSPEALEVAARENAVSEKSIHELQDLVKKIALREKIEESHEFAGDVEAAMHNGLSVRNPGLRDRGVKKAPFIVLIGANMPSILAEISFVSNPDDERRLRTAEYRQKIAESLYQGIAKYVGGLSGVKVASRMTKTSQP